MSSEVVCCRKLVASKRARKCVCNEVVVGLVGGNGGVSVRGGLCGVTNPRGWQKAVVLSLDNCFGKQLDRFLETSIALAVLLNIT